MKERIIIGKNLSSGQKKEANDSIQEFENEHRKPMEGEMEKTEEEIKVIKLANEIIAAELGKIGITDDDISPQQLHFLESEAHEKLLPGYGGRPMAQPYTGDVYFDIVGLRKSKVNLAAMLVHEMNHLKSCKKYLLQEKDDNMMSSRIYRVGYDLSTSKDVSKARMRGLNEAVTDFFTQEIWSRNKEKFAEILGISKEELQEEPESYQDAMDILKFAIEKVAKNKNEDYETVWNRIKRGMFSGDMMHLRDIEKTFGKESLKVLSLMRENECRANDLVRNYFDSENDNEKNKIKEKLFELAEKEPLLEEYENKFQDKEEITLEDAKEMKEKGVSMEDFLEYVGGKYSILFHGSRAEIPSGDKIKPSGRKEFYATDKPAIAILTAIYSSKEVTLHYPFEITEKDPLELTIKGNIWSDTIGEKGYVYLVDKGSDFENDPPGSWQYVKRAGAQEFIKRIEIEKTDFKYPVKIVDGESI